MNKNNKLYNQKYYKQYESGFINSDRSDHKRIISLAKFKKNSHVIDIGCGYGVLLSKIKAKYKIGLESNAYAVKVCRKKGLKVKEYGAVDSILPFNSNSFDYVIMNEVIEHFTNPSSVLLESKRILKEKGKIIITTPSKNIFVNDLDPTHFFEVSNSELELLLRASGFKVITHEVCGINFIDWLLRKSLFSIGRMLRKNSLQKGKKNQLVDNVQNKFDQSVFAKILSGFRKYFLWFGSQQLVIAEKE